MGFITPNDFPNLKELYTAQLRYLLGTERQIVKGLPDMIDHANDTTLKQAFQSHLQETEVHVTRLESLIGDVSTRFRQRVTKVDRAAFICNTYLILTDRSVPLLLL